MIDSTNGDDGRPSPEEVAQKHWRKFLIQNEIQPMPVKVKRVIEEYARTPHPDVTHDMIQAKVAEFKNTTSPRLKAFLAAAHISNLGPEQLAAFIAIASILEDRRDI